MDLKIQEENADRYHRLYLTGWLNSVSAGDFKNAAIPLVEEKHLLLDFQNVSLISSMGVGALLNISETAQRWNHRVIIIGCPEPVYRVVEITGFASLFYFVQHEEEALNLVRHGPRMAP